MPAGTSWPRYASAVAVAMLSMFAGSQAVHVFYQPLKDLNDKVEIEKQKLRMANANSASSSESAKTTSTATS